MFSKKKVEAAQVNPNLSIPLSQAVEKIGKQIKQGEKLSLEKISNDKKLHAVENHYNKWNNENFTLLKKVFDTKAIAKEYSSTNLSVESFLVAGLSLVEKDKKLQRSILNKLNRLQSILSSLQLLEKEGIGEKIYFLHANQTKFTEELQIELENLGYVLLVLKDIAQAGSTLFDTIQNDQDVKQAIIVLNPENENSNYPDQNLLLEFGIFVGILGRNNVFALREGTTIMPEDYHGFHYIEVGGDWKSKLRKELVKSGI